MPAAKGSARTPLGPTLEASLAPAEAEVGAVAKADQQYYPGNRGTQYANIIHSN